MRAEVLAEVRVVNANKKRLVSMMVLAGVLTSHPQARADMTSVFNSPLVQFCASCSGWKPVSLLSQQAMGSLSSVSAITQSAGMTSTFGSLNVARIANSDRELHRWINPKSKTRLSPLAQSLESVDWASPLDPYSQLIRHEALPAPISAEALNSLLFTLPQTLPPPPQLGPPGFLPGPVEVQEA